MCQAIPIQPQMPLKKLDEQIKKMQYLSQKLRNLDSD